MNIGTVADITPNSVAVQVLPAGVKASWITLTASGTSIRVGDANVGAARGAVLASGVPYTVPRIAFNQGSYAGELKVYGTGSDKVSITYGD